ncbi:hypothetical protein GETHPA_05700 [Geothrix rubra]|uniref:Htaa domain-containing protein n=1 Tax=Geothrix rubra TaxID=2927977 RepID=A0ABQ5Q2R0_9BACT|nr:hypothetical protein [Geothrix rubra]GLH69037.1 hypothetical protein GETHPA_05700 [Geothrix rubra]
MRALTEFQGDVLEWRASGTPGGFDLTAGGEVYATLAWSDPETLARVETAEGRWTLKRVGTFAQHVTLREAGAEVDLAEFRPHAFGRGKLAFKDGAEFHWTHLPHEQGTAFIDVSDRTVVQLQTLPELVVHPPEAGLVMGRVILRGTTGARSRYALLAALGWTLHLLAVHDAHLEEEVLLGAGLP